MKASKLSNLNQKKGLKAMALALICYVGFSAQLFAYDGKPQPKVSTEQIPELKDVGITEHLGAQLDLSLPLYNEAGEAVTLGTYITGQKPVILSPIYYSCPGLCNYHLNGLIDGLKEMDWSVGQKFDVIALSFDSKEKPELAAAKKKTYMQLYERPGTAGGFHFLTGSEETIKKITSSVGFKYKWVEEQNEWAHASAAIIVTPDGQISRYLPGVVFEPQTVKLALTEAGRGKIGNIIDNLVLYCFHYDPKQSKYALYAINIMKLGAALTILILALILIPFWRRSRTERKALIRSEL